MRRGADTAPLVGRDAQLDALRQVLAIGSQRPAGLVLRGEAGIGKTALWLHGLARARDEQRTVLVARPAAEERDVACSGLVDLLRRRPEPAGGEGPLDLSVAQSPLARGRALLEEVRRLTAKRPLVIAVDDTPWLDDASAQALRYTLRRLETEPVTVLATSRSADVERLDLATTLSAHPLRVLDLEPLSAAALREALASYLDRVSQPNLHRLHVLSGGNPLHAIELARCLKARPDGQRVIVLPSSLRQVMERRVADVDADLRALVELLTVGGPQPADVLAEVLGGPVTPIVDRGRGTGLLLVDEHERIRFAHPLLAAAADARVIAADRRALHARLATVVPDPEDRVRHRALSIDGPTRISRRRSKRPPGGPGSAAPGQRL